MWWLISSWRHGPPARLGRVYPDNVIADDTAAEMHEPALAHVVRGILDFSGLKFDAHRRLFDGNVRNVRSGVRHVQARRRSGVETHYTLL